MDFKFETIDRWPYGGTSARRAPFRASYPKTVDLLKSELDRINARNPALQTGHRGEDIRFDGLPRVNARTPRFAGVCLTFEKWRPTGQKNAQNQPLGVYDLLEFPCSTFDHWEDNLRAIALTLKSIRETKKYGVGIETRDQHYAGFKHKKVEAQTGNQTGKLTPEAAANVIAACAEGGWTADTLLNSSAETETAFKAAARKTHPDLGGSVASMSSVNAAIKVLRQHHAGAH
ncbi:MAG TPA: hypothetical protein VK619_01915 [Pyrinomonadaceae bacterium]|nr:hypothetical protein [Pyrinomonadaceae bacterium]